MVTLRTLIRLATNNLISLVLMDTSSWPHLSLLHEKNNFEMLKCSHFPFYRRNVFSWRDSSIPPSRPCWKTEMKFPTIWFSFCHPLTFYSLGPIFFSTFSDIKFKTGVLSVWLLTITKHYSFLKYWTLPPLIYKYYKAYFSNKSFWTIIYTLCRYSWKLYEVLGCRNYVRIRKTRIIRPYHRRLKKGF